MDNMILKIGNRVLIGAIFYSLFMSVSYGYAEGGRQWNETDSLEHPKVSILKQLEEVDPQTGARVIVMNNTNVLFYKKENEVIKGYRVRLFFDNSQSARAKAEDIKLQFESKYPGQPAYMNYTAPYFNVTVGDFSTYQDALVLNKKILEDFPKAFIVPFDIPISNLGTKVIVPVPDSTVVQELDLLMDDSLE